MSAPDQGHVWSLPHGALGVRQGDLTRATAGAVVNAANPQLAGGGGVDGALQRAAGPELLKAGRAWVKANGPLPTGQAVITPGFNLAAPWVIHTVGPVWHGGSNNEDELLASAYAQCMGLAREQGIKSVDFPAVSCGVYGFPVERAARIALSTLAENLAKGVVKTATMVIFSADAAALWTARANELFGPPD